MSKILRVYCGIQLYLTLLGILWNQWAIQFWSPSKLEFLFS